MSKVVVDITMSLDGYVAPADVGTGGAGEVGMDELQAWAVQPDPVDSEVLERATAATGAVIMGRRLFDIVDAPDVWTADMAYGAQPVDTAIPFFVVTHAAPDDARLARELGLDLTFVSGVVDAVRQAQAVAAERNVVIMGGGDVVDQALEQGLADELHLHLSPMALGAGTPLFRAGSLQRYRQLGVRASTGATHLTYERLPAPAR